MVYTLREGNIFSKSKKELGVTRHQYINFLYTLYIQNLSKIKVPLIR